MTTDLDLMTALFARLQTLTGAVVVMGEPPAVQDTPLVYLMSFQTDYNSNGTRNGEVIEMRPRIRLVVRWQDAPNAETELLTLQGQVKDLITADPTLDGACRVRWEQAVYGYLNVAGTRYRLAQLAPVLTTM